MLFCFIFCSYCKVVGNKTNRLCLVLSRCADSFSNGGPAASLSCQLLGINRRCGLHFKTGNYFFFLSSTDNLVIVNCIFRGSVFTFVQLMWTYGFTSLYFHGAFGSAVSFNWGSIVISLSLPSTRTPQAIHYLLKYQYNFRWWGMKM